MVKTKFTFGERLILFLWKCSCLYVTIASEQGGDYCVKSHKINIARGFVA